MAPVSGTRRPGPGSQRRTAFVGLRRAAVEVFDLDVAGATCTPEDPSARGPSPPSPSGSCATSGSALTRIPQCLSRHKAGTARWPHGAHATIITPPTTLRRAAHVGSRKLLAEVSPATGYEKLASSPAQPGRLEAMSVRSPTQDATRVTAFAASSRTSPGEPAAPQLTRHHRHTAPQGRLARLSNLRY